jgi:NADPH-dependent ferric siderophore reductase
MKIYRYSFPLSSDPAVISMPALARVVDAVWQPERNAFSIYAEVPSIDDIDPSFHLEREQVTITSKRQFRTFATGEEVQGKHIRSIVMPDGFHVFHIYEASA